MSSADWISLLAVSEIAVLVSLVLMAVVAWIFMRRAKDRKAAVALLDKVRAGESERLAELERTLVESGLAPSDARIGAQRLLHGELEFYDRFVLAYLDRDAAAVQALDERLRDLVEPYLALKREPAAAEPVAVEGPDRAPEIERLKQAVRNLSEEMGLYHATLNRVFSEYTAMFGVHLDPKVQLTAKEILNRLESGELKGEGEEGKPES